jgi:hypothetical protein
MSDAVRDGLWERLVQGRFRDKRLPLDWFGVIEKDYGLFDQFLNALRDGYAYEAGVHVTRMRMQAVQVRLIGGKPVLGDLLFMRGIEGYAKAQNAFYDENEPRLLQLKGRLAAEFPPNNR